MARFDVYENCILSAEGRMKLEYHKAIEDMQRREEPIQVRVEHDGKATIQVGGAENWTQVYAVMIPAFTWVCSQMITEILNEKRDLIKGGCEWNVKQCAATAGEMVFRGIMELMKGEQN